MSRTLVVTLTLAVLGLAGCSSALSDEDGVEATGSGVDRGVIPPVLDSSMVHEVDLAFDQADFEAMVASYVRSGVKDWIPATVTVDGVAYDQAGVRLKGNSSLRGLRGPEASSLVAQPERLPWLIRLDRYVEGQHHQGIHDLVIRSNRSITSLNEAVALDLLARAGLPSQRAIATSFSVGDGTPLLRLAVEHPTGRWAREHFEGDGALYKARSGRTYAYRGPDVEAYSDAFDQKAGDEVADLAPLIAFLDFVNNSDDTTFAAGIADLLDIEAFASYLALEELVANGDAIDGGGNNSYLWLDARTESFTVVAWDHNLAFGLGPSPARVRADPAQRGGAVLVKRFLAVPDHDALIRARKQELSRALYESGVAADVLSDWVAVLEQQAPHLVDRETIHAEADRVASYFAPTASSAGSSRWMPAGSV